MTAIWHNDGEGWRLMQPAGFPYEKDLEDRIEEAPQMLPLAGSPALVVVGRQVRLGANAADLIAVEPSGRLAVIEVKLANNPDSRRGIIAQVLTYAAYLHGMDIGTLEDTVLGPHLERRNWSSLAEAVREIQQADAIDVLAFNAALADSLATGRFRLVLVLDDAPAELVRLVTYLEAVTAGLLIDLVTVSSYQVGGSQILVPRRVEGEPERATPPSPPAPESVAAAPPPLTASREEFAALIDAAPPDVRQRSRRYLEWALDLERHGLAILEFVHDKRGPINLRVKIPGDMGLITFWNNQGDVSCGAWRSVFERRAPEALARLDQLVAPKTIGTGGNLSLAEDILSVVLDAYREAAGGKVTLPGDAQTEE